MVDVANVLIYCFWLVKLRTFSGIVTRCSDSATEEESHISDNIIPYANGPCKAAALRETKLSLHKCIAGAGQCDGIQPNSWKQL